MFRLYTIAPLLIAVMLAGCSKTPDKSPDVTGAVRKSLQNQPAWKDVSVAQDREKGVVTLSGHVPTEADKQQVEATAKGVAVGQVVADEIAVLPPNAGSDAKTLYSDLDKGIQSNLDAALIQNKIPGTIRHEVKNGVVTLTGTVDSEAARGQAQQVAAAVPNVQQVVNELQITNQKASSTN